MMVTPKILAVSKCVAIITLLLGIVIFIKMWKYSNSINSILLEENDSEIKNSSENELEGILSDDFDLCFFSPYDIAFDNKKEIDTRSRYEASFGIKKELILKEERHPLFSNFLKFNSILSHLRIKAVVIEPSVLFCTLSNPLKKILMKRNFTLERNKGAQTVVSLGIMQKDAMELEKKETQNFLKKNGFRAKFAKRRTLKWMRMQNSTNNDKSFFTSHIFFTHKVWTVHLVVFLERSNYLWHASLKYQPFEYIPSLERLNFVRSDSAFEKFTSVSLGHKVKILEQILIPHHPAKFLFQIESSSFLECNDTVVDQFRKKQNISDKDLPVSHSSVSVPVFNKILIQSLQELKSLFDPFFLRFFIWSGTLLGWYRQCGVIPYTNDIDLGSWASDVDDVESILELFLRNDTVFTIQQKMGIASEGLEFNLKLKNVRVDVFFLYTESNGTWYAGHRPSKKYYFKYHHPNFSLCSADLLGEKVLVPCESENVIATEYGPNWMTPVSRWNYETSIFNRGPNIYWNKTLWDKVLFDF